MSSLYLYGFLKSEEEIELPLSGLADEPLYPVSCQGIAAAVSFFSGRVVSPTETNLMAHEGALELIMDQHAILPARFGALLPNERAVQSLISRHRHDLESNLSLVEGKAEFGVKILWTPPSPVPDCKLAQPPIPVLSRAAARHSASCTPTPFPGTQYLLTRLRRGQQGQHVAAQAGQLLLLVDAALDPHASLKRACLLPSPRMLLNAAYLIPREETAAFKRAFYQLKDSNPPLKFLLSGPWPPYNFVSVALQPPSLDPSPLLNAISQAATSSLCRLTAKGTLS